MSAPAVTHAIVAEQHIESPEIQRTIVLATDGSASAVAATRVAAALARQWATVPHACTVVPAQPFAFDPSTLGAVCVPALVNQLDHEVDGQLGGWPESAEWSRESVVGSPAAEIVRIAEARHASVILLGLRPHAFLDRVFRDETALSVMRHASIPVLAVTPPTVGLPRRVAVAVDFSRASIAAARAALTVMEDGGSLLLVYVEPSSDPPAADAEGFATIYAQGVSAAFARLRNELSARTNARIESVVLRGAVAPELLSFAQRAEIDLIAVGSQRHSIARRAVVGSVTTALARAASRSLLVIPPAALPNAR
jgi:nucleotide-binding universal stress UspA family protein